jgi:hypothetical protein
MDVQLVGLREASRSLTAQGYEISHSTLSRDIKKGVIKNHAPEGKPPLICVADVIEARRSGVLASMQRSGPDLLVDTPPEDDPLDDDGDDNDDDTGRPGRTEDRKPSLNQAATAEKAIKAQLLKLRLEKERGTLLDRAAVIDALMAIGQALREGLANTVDTLAADSLGITDIGELRAQIEKRDREVLTKLVEQFRKAASLGAIGS